MYDSHLALVGDHGAGRLPDEPSKEDIERALYGGLFTEFRSLVAETRPGMLPTLSVELTADGVNLLSEGHLVSLSLPCTDDDVYEALYSLSDKVTA